MAKRIVLVVMLVAMCLGLCACAYGNYDAWDTVYTYDRVIISLADGSVVTGRVQNWRDYEDGDQIQVKVDGKTYLVHSMNVTLIAE